MRRSLTIGLVALAALAPGLAGCGDDSARSTSGGGVDLGRDAEGIGSRRLPGLGDAADVALAGYRDRPLVVNFFASTCAPCVREMPALEVVHQAAAGAVGMLGVAVNDRAADALELADSTGVTYDLAADPQGELFTAAGATLLPTTLVLDGAGDVVRRLTGEITAAELVEVLADTTGVEIDLP